MSGATASSSCGPSARTPRWAGSWPAEWWPWSSTPRRTSASRGAAAPAPAQDATGLYHVALRIGTSLDELRAARAHLEANGITDMRVRDHVVSQSIYISDPDGNAIELYVDADPAIWRDKPESVANSRPLEL